MTNLRRMAKKNRGVMLVVVGILVFGLLYSYVAMSMGGNSLESKISAQEKKVLNQKKRLESNPNDYSGNYTLGQLLIELAELYYYKHDYLKHYQAFLEAAAAFGKAYDNRPASMSAEGQADLLSLQASLMDAGGKPTEAETIYEAAVDCAPLYWTVNRNYFNFLFRAKKEDGRESALEKALEYQERLLEYKESLLVDDPDKEMSKTIENLEKVEGLIADLEGDGDIDWSR
ncbi:MAG: hypothetical protein FWD39_04040 [Clostridiales bacterium]|nr:hypothetical protein [Clostridiales bacterium]